MGCTQSTLQDPALQQERKAAHDRSEQSPVAAPSGSAPPPAKHSTATPYNRAKDRVDAIPESKTVTINGVTLTYAYVSQRGFYPEEPFKANQDAYCVHDTELCKGRDDAFFGVFDGHGKDGDGCAIFSKKELPKQVQRHLGKKPAILTKDLTQQALKQAHVDTNQNLRRDTTVDDSLSGTTAVSVYFHGRRNRITVCNVGDSRVVLGQAENNASGRPSLKALPLSRDQTPYRKDERARIKATGARVLSLDQLEGLEPIEDLTDNGDDDFVLGEDLDEGGDPPRVWHPKDDYPGTAFTRSIGDALAEDLGVYAEPEMLTRELQQEDKILVLASDGVYEFLTNQSVIDICAKFSDPLEACRAVVAEAYELWLQYELRTDDITIICMFIDGVKQDNRRGSQGASSEFDVSALKESFGKDDVADSLDAVALPTEGARPVRKTVSKEKSRAIQKLKKQGESMKLVVQEEVVDLKKLATPKTAEEKEAIAEAIKASVMFRNVTKGQRELIYSCMESMKVKAGQWVIRQGSVGDRFFIADEGKYEVRIVPDGEEDVTGQGGHIVHQYEGSRERHAHPSFGELALMHSAPRSASIIATSNGHLWALHRAAFRQILLEAQDHRKDLKRILGTIPYFEHLDSDGINKLAAIMEDITFGRGENVIMQGQKGDKMFVIDSGSAYSTAVVGGETKRKTLNKHSFFGEEILSGDEDAYGETVMALHTLTCWQLDANLLKQTMGPLLRGE